MGDNGVRKIGGIAAIWLVAAVALLSAPQTAGANVPFQQIGSPGPIANIYIGNELSCQVGLAGDDLFSFFPPDTAPGDCGTFLQVGSEVFSPDFAAHDESAAGNPDWTPWTPGSQSPVTGTGTSDDPYEVTTVVQAGATGVELRERIRYVTGAASYSVHWRIANTTAAPLDIRLYRAGDCYLAGTDSGYGAVDPTSGGYFCTANPNNVPAGRVIGFAASSGITNGLEGSFGTVWAAIDGSDLPNTCQCDSNLDNGVAVQYNLTAPAAVGDEAGIVTAGATSQISAGSEPPVEPPVDPPVDPPVEPPGTLPPPESGTSVNVEPVKGKVTAKCKGDNGFRALTSPEQVAVGCLIDTTKGRVRLTSETDTDGETQSAVFYDGVFRIKQKPGKSEVTLRLSGELDCGKGGKPRLLLNERGRRRRGGRGLFGDGNGDFTTQGNNGAGSVRGTKWFVGDDCDGATWVVVKKGVVSFRDFVADKTVRVEAGETYSTEPRGK